jgi:formamidopyrimidine-DNA glycosylase
LKRSAILKASLLDQSFIAGIGNVYGDEILFEAGMRPNRKASEPTIPRDHTRLLEGVQGMAEKT